MLAYLPLFLIAGIWQVNLGKVRIVQVHHRFALCHLCHVAMGLSVGYAYGKERRVKLPRRCDDVQVTAQHNPRLVNNSSNGDVFRCFPRSWDNDLTAFAEHGVRLLVSEGVHFADDCFVLRIQPAVEDYGGASVLQVSLGVAATFREADNIP